MYARASILFPLGLLALVALLTLWIDHSVKEPGALLGKKLTHDEDYQLQNFVTTKTDVDGSLKFRLAAVQMTHFPDTDTTDLVRPRFTQYGVDKPYTQIQAQKGSVAGKGEIVEMRDHVEVVREASEGKGKMNLYTSALNIYPDKELVTTDQPVIITQAPKTVIHATGMVFDKKAKTLTLTSRVKVHYEKPRLVPSNKSGKRVQVSSAMKSEDDKASKNNPGQASPGKSVTKKNNATASASHDAKKQSTRVHARIASEAKP